MELADEEKAASFDGDADRIVYYFKESGVFRLLVRNF